MSKKRVISEEVFAAMLDQAIEDLKQSGLDAGEVFSIVEREFRCFLCPQVLQSMIYSPTASCG